MENQLDFYDWKEEQSSITADIYMVRRNIEKSMPDCCERERAIMKLDEATFWLKEIPIHIL